jgi:hypothetical protein
VTARDMLEKKIVFKDQEGKVYVYFTSVSDDFKEKEDDIVRATTILGFHVFETLDDGTKKFTSVNQTDVALKGAALIGFKALAPQVIPKNLKIWH